MIFLKKKILNTYIFQMPKSKSWIFFFEKSEILSNSSLINEKLGLFEIRIIQNL